MTARDILVPGKDNWFQNYDFNAKYGLKPGDTVILKGNYGDIDARNINGITFLCEGPVSINSFTLYPGARDVNLIGDKSSPLKVSGTRFGIKWDSVGKMILQNIHVDGNPTGFKITHDPGVIYPLDFVELEMDNCSAGNIKLEGYYIGANKLGGPFIKGKITNSKAFNCGWDGIQVRNGSFTIEDCEVDNVGLVFAGGDPAGAGQDHGILVGGNTKDSVIRRCKTSRVSGFGIFNNGFGNHIIEDNEIESKGVGIFVSNHGFNSDLQKVGIQVFNIHRNKITSESGINLRAYKNNDTVKMTINYSDGGKTDVQAGINFNQDKPPVEEPPTRKLKAEFNVYDNGDVEVL
jgi:hypothetical protein